MKHIRSVSIILAALAILVVGLGATTQTTQAATCRTYYTVQRGQSLSSIGAYYGISWKTLASANGITAPYTIYSGQSLCIPSGGVPAGIGGRPGPYGVSYSTENYSWKFRVIGVVSNTSVTIETLDFPDNMLYEVQIGCSSCGVDAVTVGDLDSDAGGTFKKVYSIPEEFSGVSNLYIRLVQVNKGKTQTAYFAQ